MPPSMALASSQSRIRIHPVMTLPPWSYLYNRCFLKFVPTFPDAIKTFLYPPSYPGIDKRAARATYARPKIMKKYK